MYGNKCLGSSVDFLEPLDEKGWQGNPPDKMSTHPRNFPNGNSLRFENTGHGCISFASIFATKLAIAKASIST